MSKEVMKTIYRKNYKPVGFIVDSIDLCFDLFDEYALVTNTMNLKNLDQEKPLELQGESLELVSICIDDAILEGDAYELNGYGLVINKTPEEFTLKIVTKIFPQDNLQLSGLYRSHKLFCTQCEAEGFRRITYFFDRPDVLTTYTTKIIADKHKYPVLLSNGNLIDSGAVDQQRHFVLWQDPFKKPSYLFALVAGDLEYIEDLFITMSGREIKLQIFVEHGNKEKCWHAMKSLQKSMRWDEEVYGLEYDLDIFMIVAVSDFNMGAMENKGLNVFNTKYILADERSATDDDFAGVEGVVAHEYFHNWTGNRVTCRDWFQLSLKEGLTVFRDQEFSRDMNSRSVNRIDDVKILRANQFPEDAGPMAHPVRPESYIEINNFYTSTIYNKGAEVIRMQHTLLGDKGYRKGMDLYFERHDGQAVTINDFVCAMEDANQLDLCQFKRWYSQAGTPDVKAKVIIEDNNLKLTLSQYCRSTPGHEEKLPFYIPIKIAIFSSDGSQYELDNNLIILKEEKQQFEFNNIKDGAVISLLRDFSAPVNLSFTQTDAELKILIDHETDGFARFEAMQTLQKRQLLILLKEYLNNQPLVFNNSIIELFNSILHQEQLDDALKAQLLQTVDFESLVSNLKDINVSAIMAIKDFYRQNIANQCQGVMLDVYDKLRQQLLTSDSDENLAAKRKLKNVLLSYLSKADIDNISQIKQQFDNATNMTDEVSAYKLLVDVGGDVAKLANQKFYDKWSQQELVLDKWFSVQAMAEHEDVLKSVKKLMAHDYFHISNPNKVRALIGAFTMANPRAFHCHGGYQLLTNVIIELDQLNPQTAARLVTPFTRWRRYDESLRVLMKAALKQLLQQPKLSKDVYEIVSKSLEGQ